MGDLLAATEAAEIAYELAPNAPEVLQLLGLLHLHRQSNDVACEILQLAVNANKQDPISWLALANAKQQALHRTDRMAERATLEMAIHAYGNVIQLKGRRGFTIPHQVLNNMAVLQFEAGYVTSAAITLHAALNTVISNVPGTSETSVPLSLTTSAKNSMLWRKDHVEDHETKLCKHVSGTSLQHKEGIQMKSTGSIDTQGKNRPDAEPSSSAAGCCSLYTRQEASSETKTTKSSVASLYVNLAHLYASLGRCSMASELLLAALQLEPRSLRCLLLLAHLDLIGKQHSRAQSYIDSAVNFALTSESALSPPQDHAADALAVAWTLQYEINDLTRTLNMLHQLDGVPQADAYARLNLSRLHLRGLIDSVTLSEHHNDCRGTQINISSDHASAILHDTPSCSTVLHSVFVCITYMIRSTERQIVGGTHAWTYSHGTQSAGRCYDRLRARARKHRGIDIS
tara:strand:+ start:92 stop:1462 length:1371 start_codon:yes stop_codon:yes gene_type:complete